MGKKQSKNYCLNPFLPENKLNQEEYQRILKEKEVYLYNWKNNLSEGAIPFTVEKETEQKLLQILKQITEKISLGFCSVDIIETENHEFYILEINSGVMMTNYMKLIPNGSVIAKEIYKEAIQTMMKK